MSTPVQRRLEDAWAATLQDGVVTSGFTADTLPVLIGSAPTVQQAPYAIVYCEELNETTSRSGTFRFFLKVVVISNFDDTTFAEHRARVEAVKSAVDGLPQFAVDGANGVRMFGFTVMSEETDNDEQTYGDVVSIEGGCGIYQVIDTDPDPDPVELDLPTDNLVLYLNEDSGSAGSNPILVDQSSEGNNPTQATTASQPTGRIESLNGLDLLVFDFDGVDDFILVPLVVPRPFTAFLLYKSSSPRGRLMSGTTPDSPGNFLLGSHSTGARWCYADASVGSPDGANGIWYLLQLNAQSGSSDLYANGSIISSSSANGTWGNTLSLGGFTGEFGGGSIGGLVVYSDIDEGRNADAYSFLSEKYNAWLE